MTQSGNPFTRTGALRLNHPLFRGRAAELDRLEQACLADLDFFPLIYGGRQNGKTTVLLRLEERLKSRFAEGVRVCRVDFQNLPRATAHAAYHHLARRVAQVLPHVPQIPELTDAPALGDFLEATLDNSAVQRLVLLLDELGALPDTTREDLAHILRALHTRRLHSPALAKVQFVLTGGVELYHLAVVEASALSNVCEVMRLGDLSETDAVDLVIGGLVPLGMDVVVATAISQAIYARVHGHPYFTQRLGELIANQQIAGGSPNVAAVEDGTRKLLEQSDPLLEHLRRSVTELRLEDAAWRLLSASQRTSRTDDATERLELLGLAHRAERYWEPRSPLLSVALGEWLKLSLHDADNIVIAARAVRQSATERYLSELKLEQTAVTSHAERATTPDEQIRLQRRAKDLANEIRQLEVVQREQTQPPDDQPVADTDPHPEPPVQPPEPVVTPEPSIQSAALNPPPVPPVQLLDNQSAADTDSRLDPPVQKGAAQPQPPKLRPAYLPTLVHVPAGPFLMGSSDSDRLADNDEKPQHTLTLPDYWIGQTEVTNAQFRPFVEGDGYTNRDYWTEVGWAWKEKARRTQPYYWDDAQWNGDNQPVVGVRWFEAVAYCFWLSAQTGHPFRLPTEAEWEKAARGSDGRIWPWGSAWAAGRANTREAGRNQTTPVGQYPEGASPYGALDMAGNVFEWCATVWRKPYPYTVEEEWTEVYLEGGEDRVLRGGSWYSEQRYARGAYRYFLSARFDNNFVVGLRVASSSPYP